MTKKTGRPPIAPIDLTEGEQVSVLRSYGLGDEEIAEGLGIGVTLLRQRYRDELSEGGERARQAMLCRVYAAGLAGNVGAAKLYLSATANKSPGKSPWDIRKERQAARARNATSEFPEWDFLTKGKDAK
jgi:hypothetical protein